ncbi:peptidoglycan DD-metalloendopeptidase family protein [Devosia faecipullorum]|uniref:peptidoglycan DD-metalloendopeptidase family protein n=1 Tax=Devosia faecipullorum TaxID=2755039 RepID=UPI00187B3C6F|nr:peptidoglycan DD-metalloendopeptidase family protein [Devosia faecipullorum]MBE7731735.1 peptidoglycan DD-metalloendopeptidase family protein [Devosia faecipullorum]
MSIRVSLRPRRTVAIAGMIAAAVALSGCNSLGSRSFGDPTVTGSVAQAPSPTFNQPMPASLGAPQSTQVAASQYLPPAPVGGGWSGGGNTLPPAPVGNGFAQPSFANNAPVVAPGVQTQALPPLNSSTSMGATQTMPAQQTLAPMPATPPAIAMGVNPAASSALPVNSSVPVQAAANTNGYTHTIAAGESLHTIARRYDVTAQAIVLANGLSSPDKIIVGQKITIPGRGDLNAGAPATQIASIAPTTTGGVLPAERPTNLAAPAAATPVAAAPVTATPAPVAQPVAAPVAVQQQASIAPAAEPALSGNDKFGWPVSGRVITDFAASRGTGINIDVPEGSSVKAAENGTVIYVGSGVEGYGNLILVRHPNGFVSAYAHLKNMSVAKGAVVSRGQAIGTVGQTGSVSRPQLHFELRKGATPVDPVPLLAG